MTGSAPPAHAQDHAALILAVARDQSRDAFAQLFQHFAPRVKSYLLSLGTNPSAAEELAQETLMIVWRKAAFFDRGRAGASTWIFTIARNLRIDVGRKQRSALAYSLKYAEDPDAHDDAAPADAVIFGAERDARVRQAMTCLSAEQVEVVRLSFFQEKPQSEIAKDLGIPLGTVKSRVRLAMARLRERLEDLL